MGITQSAVSKNLAEIERIIDQQLFQRIGRGIRPRAEALALLPKLARAIAQIESVEGAIEDLQIGSKTRVTIAAIPSLAMSIVPRAIASAEPMGIQTHLLMQATDAVKQSVADLRADLGLIYTHEMPDSLRLTPLDKRQCQCILPRGHPLSGRNTLGPRDLADTPIITYPAKADIGGRLRAVFESEGVPLEPTIVSNNTLCSLFMASEGNGVAIVDVFTGFQAQFPNLKAIPFSPAVEIRRAVIRSTRVPLSHSANQFYQLLTT